MSPFPVRFLRRFPRTLAFLGALACAGAVSLPASANERHFTYTYESAVLPRGAKELEVWTTYRTGRDHPWSQFDHRFEFEVGVTDRLMTAFYVNASGTGETLANGERVSSFEYQGVSSEWKWKLLDPTADAIGLALYGELLFAPKETEIETKIILDKRIGQFLFAFNGVSELDFEHGKNAKGETDEGEWNFEADLAAAAFLSPHWTAGLELHSTNKLEEELASSVLYAGPVLAYAAEGWWAAFTAMRQLHAFKGATKGGYSYEDNEKINLRLIFSFHI